MVVAQMTDNRRVDFHDLRARADFRAILAHYGLTPKGKGDQVKILCPFHDDTAASCSVNLATRLFHCFACPAKGNVLEFVHRMENRDGQAASLRQAANVLMLICGMVIDGKGMPVKPRETPTAPRRVETAPTPPPAPVASTEPPTRPQKGNGAGKVPDRNKPLGFSLTLDPLHPYLDERGIPHELRERFGLGFCEKGIMAGRVCIPIHNAEGQVVAYAGRWAGNLEDLPEGKGKYELPSGFRKEHELFNLHRVKDCKHLVVVEGFFGAIHLHELRTPAVALMGTSVSIRQLELLAHANARHVTVMLDGDEAGREAAERVAGALANVAWSRIVHLADGMQPDRVDRAELGRLLGRSQEE